MSQMMQSTAQSPVDRILETIAEKDNTDPAAMEPPLAKVIDPDALNALLKQKSVSDGDGIEIRFSYRDHTVVVTQSGDIQLL